MPRSKHSVAEPLDSWSPHGKVLDPDSDYFYIGKFHTSNGDDEERWWNFFYTPRNEVYKYTAWDARRQEG